MEQFIQISAYRNEDFKLVSNLQLIEDGVPREAVFHVMLGMADGLEEQGYYVEMELSYE